MIQIVRVSRSSQQLVLGRIWHHLPFMSTQSISRPRMMWATRNTNHNGSFRQYLSIHARLSSSGSFHGITLDDTIHEKNLHRSSQIQEAEVVQSAEEKRITRSLIKEVTRAKLTAHYSNNVDDVVCDTSGGDEANKLGKVNAYERRLLKLDETQTLHRGIDPKQTMAHSHSCMIIGELQYEIGHLDDAQDMYMTALKQIMSVNGTSSDIGSGDDEYHEESVRGQLMIAQCMHSLGAIHARCGEYDEALRWYNESLKTKQQILHHLSDEIIDGEPAARSLGLRFELGKTYNGLATLEVMKCGEVQWENAESLFREAEWSYLHDHDVLTLNELGNQTETDTKQIDATKLTQDTIQRMTPRQREALINVRSNMGELLRQRGQYEKAATTLQSALDVARIALDVAIEKEASVGGTNIPSSTSCLGEPSPDEQKNVVVDLLLQIADVLMSANNFDEASATYEQALSAHISFRNQENYTLQSDLTSFLPSLSAASKIDSIDLSAATRVEATIRTNLAHALAQIGKENLSLEQYKAALSIKRSIGGNFHLEVAHTLMDMGALLGGPMRDFVKALICFKEALYIYRTNLEEVGTASEIESQSKHRNEKPSMQPDDEDTKKMERFVENAVKNISLIEAALLKDQDGKSIRRRK